MTAADIRYDAFAMLLGAGRGGRAADELHRLTRPRWPVYAPVSSPPSWTKTRTWRTSITPHRDHPLRDVIGALARAGDRMLAAPLTADLFEHLCQAVLSGPPPP